MVKTSFRQWKEVFVIFGKKKIENRGLYDKFACKSFPAMVYFLNVRVKSVVERR